MQQEIDEITEEIRKYNLKGSREIKLLKHKILKEMEFETEELKKYHKLLNEYRYIDEIDEIRYGSYIRWFNISKKLDSIDLMPGGFVVSLKPSKTKDDIIILCKNGIRFFNVKMNQSIIFQKNTNQEKLLIQILDTL
jgi:hypothetical protein